MADIETGNIEQGGQAAGTQTVGIAASDSDTATLTEDTALPMAIEWTTAPETPANIIAQKGADFNETTFGNITQFARSACGQGGRNVQVVFSAGWDGGDIEVTGVTCDGSVATDTIADPGGAGTVQGAVGFLFITGITNDGTWSAGTVDVQFGLYLAVPVNSMTPTLAQVIDTFAGTDMTPNGAISAAGLVDIQDAPADGTNTYIVGYTLGNTYTDAGHTHGLTDGGHGH